MKLRLLPFLLTYSLAANRNEVIHHHHYYYSDANSESEEGLPHGAYPLMADVGFRPFSFGQGNQGLYADQSFFFSFPFETRLLVTDCFCGGDRFILHDYSTLSGEYPVTEGCELANVTCNFFSEDPQVCAFSEGWCASRWIRLARGYHNLTIEILTSPFLSGTGYLILQSLTPDGEPSCEPFCYYGIENGFRR